MFLTKIDLWLFLPSCLLIVLGTVVLSSVAPYIFPQYFLYIVLGLAMFFLFANLDIDILRTLSPFLYIFSILLLLITDVFGVLTRGSVRWIDLGFITLQPSELVKPLLLVVFAGIVAQRWGLKRFLWVAAVCLLPVILIFAQPDLGSSIVVFAGFLGVVFISGFPVWLFALFGALSAIVSPLFWHVLADYQKDRFLSFIAPSLDPLGRGYNSIQAMISVGAGGFWGRGLGQGTQSHLAFLPERHTDFIFAALSEELGFFGGILILGAFVIILTRLIVILQNSNDIFQASLVGGIFATIFVQAGVNIGMNMGLLPITGIPLPFVSSGGSSLLAMAAILGLASNVSLHARSHSGII